MGEPIFKSISKDEIEEIMKNYTPPKPEEPKFTISLVTDYLVDNKENKIASIKSIRI